MQRQTTISSDNGIATEPRTTAEILAAVDERIRMIDTHADKATAHAAVCRTLNAKNKTDLALLSPQFAGNVAASSAAFAQALADTAPPKSTPKRDVIDWKDKTKELIEMIRISMPPPAAARALGIPQSKVDRVSSKMSALRKADPALHAEWELSRARRIAGGDKLHDRPQVETPLKWGPIIDEAVDMAIDGRTSFEIGEHFDRRECTVSTAVAKHLALRGMHDVKETWLKMNSEERARRKAAGE